MAITQELRNLVWKITGDDTDVKKKIDNTEKKAKGFGSNVNKALGAISFVAVAAGITKISKELIKAASDAQETQQKFSVTFQGLEDQSEAIASNLAQNYGLARTESKKLLSDTGDLLTGFGLQRQEALDLSANVQALAVDLASFTNIEGGASRASEALTKGLLGEREQMKALGIAITETELIRFAEEQGKVFKEMSKGEKALLTYQLAVKQSQNAIGDFERSSGSLANQQRVTAARIDDLKVALGDQLLPAATESAKALNDFLGDARNVEIIAKSLKAVISGAKVAMLQFIIPLQLAGVVGQAAFVLLQEGIRILKEKLEPLIETMDKVKSSIFSMANTVKSFFTSAVDTVNKKLGSVVKTNEVATKAFNILKGGIADIAKGAITDLNNVLVDTKEIFNDTTDAMDKTGEAGKKAAEETESAWEKANRKLKTFFSDNKATIENALEITGVFKDALGSIGDIVDANTEKRIEAIDREREQALISAGVQEETERERIQNELDEAIASGNTLLQKEKEDELKRLEINEDFEKKKAEADYQGKLASWKLDKTQAGAGIAIAIIKALPNVGLAAATALAGGLQLAAIQSSKPEPPSFDVGTLGVKQDTLAQVHKDEIILPPSLSKEATEKGINISPAGGSVGKTIIQFVTNTKEKLYEVMYDDGKNGVFNLPDYAIVRV